MSAPKLVEGQKVWWVPADTRYRDQSSYVEIMKVGRKWATLSSGHKVDLVSFYADGGNFSPPGRIWLSEGAWKEYRARCDAWHKLADVTRRLVLPSHLSLADLNDILAKIAPLPQEPTP
jgi:hypothetical protein